MRYDDRLTTVLAQPADRAHDRAVRWRQLVELLARGGEAGDRSLFDRAIAAVREDAPLVDELVRMAAARSIASRPAPLALVSAFAGDRLGVAAPVLAAARLTASEWAEVGTCATPECRRFIASLRAESPAADAPQARPPPSRLEADAPIPSISEVVARIERLRHSREHPDPESPSPSPAPAPASEPPRLFRWESDESGEIAWVEGAPRGALIGRSIARAGEGGEIDRRIERAFPLRVPFRDATLELAEGGVVGGSWKISGIPAFDPSSGRFAGYRGIAERERAEAAAEPPMFAVRDPESLRELAHEIKTPLNAILGFAEIISGQYLGPAERAYRERAQEIVAQARLLLTAIDDLDFAARLHSQRSAAASTDLGHVIDRLAEELGPGGASFDISGSPATSIDRALAERLVSRFCKAVMALTDKPPAFSLGEDDAHCIVGVPDPGLETAGEPGLGLRLVLGLARIAGGDLRISGGRVALLLPKA